MKLPHLIVLAIVTAFAIACQPKNSTSPETEKIDAIQSGQVGNYGAEVREEGVVSPAEMIAAVEQKGNFEGKISGVINEVCTKKGCWLTMELPNGESMRVTFKDYAFFVPTDSQGFPVILDGVAVLTETDVNTLRHYAEDQGKSKEEVDAIKTPEREITFEAVGVKIKEKA